MQARLRQILEQQHQMLGSGYEDVELIDDVYGRGDVANKRAAGRSPWISFLKKMVVQTGMPYNEVMRNPKIRQMYHSGSGATVGGSNIVGSGIFKHNKKANTGLARYQKIYKKVKEMYPRRSAASLRTLAEKVYRNKYGYPIAAAKKVKRRRKRSSL